MFYAYERGGGRTSFSHAEGRGRKGFGVMFSNSFEVLTILKAGDNKFPFFKKRGGGEGRKTFYQVLRGGANSFEPAFFPFCSPPPRN